MIETPNKIIQESIDIIKLPTSSGLKIRGLAVWRGITTFPYGIDSFETLFFSVLKRLLSF